MNSTQQKNIASAYHHIFVDRYYSQVLLEKWLTTWREKNNIGIVFMISCSNIQIFFDGMLAGTSVVFCRVRSIEDVCEFQEMYGVNINRRYDNTHPATQLFFDAVSLHLL